jgi:hypothetical protein
VAFRTAATHDLKLDVGQSNTSIDACPGNGLFFASRKCTATWMEAGSHLSTLLRTERLEEEADVAFMIQPLSEEQVN